MPDYTYLVNDVIEACETDSQEFLNYIPKMVNRAEERLTRDLDDYGMITYTSVAVSNGNNQMTLPTGARSLHNINVVVNGSKINMLQRTDEFLNDYWPVATSTGIPKYYARLTDTLIRLAPTPTSTSDGEVVYVSRPTTLTSATNTNYFTDKCYDALFYGTMVEAMMFNKNFTTLPVFEGRYVAIVASLQNQARQTRRDDLQKSNITSDNTVGV
tara:strand:- start:357 stop:998 length:642 start_codon:yes stop_codon:yes gene_type:complete